MKILLVSQYFWPETFIINDLVKCLVANGHEVEVLTGKPNYPEGTIFKGYTSTNCSSELYNETVKVHRVPIIPRGKGGAFRLILNYLSFVFSGCFYFPRFVKNKQFEVILVFVPSPITSVISAIYLKKRFKLPLAVWVQDLWPESVSITGFIKNRFLINLLEKLVRWIYGSSDTLLVQSKAFLQPIAKYVNAEKIIYYPNSWLEAPTDLTENEQMKLPGELLTKLEENISFVFAGNLGKAQALETILKAAEQVKHLPQCKIFLVGSGSMSEWIKDQIIVNKLNNVILTGRFPATLMPMIFSRAAGLLVTLKRSEIFSYTIPSKIQAYLASGRPVLAALDGEGARIVEEAGAGLVSPAEDAVALAQNMERLYFMSTVDREQLGQAGRFYFLKHFEMIKQSQQLIDILKRRVLEQGAV